MSSASTDALKLAYQQSAENMTLLTILLQALRSDGQPEEALTYIDDAFDLYGQDPANRLLAGEIALDAEEPRKALDYCSEDTAEECLLRAKAHLSLDAGPESLSAYEKAIALNPTLEDSSVRAEIDTQVNRDQTVQDNHNVVSLRSFTGSQGTGDHSHSGPTDTVAPLFLESEPTNVDFQDVGGLEDVKKQIKRKIIMPFQKPSLFQKFKRKAGGGVLLYGPPGCGKTLLARATAGECQARFYNVAISDILDMWIGESERKLNAIFEQARRTQPAVIFFDELEALAGKRQYNSEGASAKLVSQFLSEMDGFSSNNEGILVLGATNVPWSIDPAFRRPGRFDRIQFIPPPDQEARVAILTILIEGRPVEGSIDLSHIAKNTSGFSGADLNNLIETACDDAIEMSIDQGREVPLHNGLLLNALKATRPTTIEWLTTARNYAKYSNEGGQYDEVVDFLKKYGK